MIEKLESPKELADRLGWPVSRIRTLISQKQLRHHRIGKRIMIPLGAMSEFMNHSEVKPYSLKEHEIKRSHENKAGSQ